MVLKDKHLTLLVNIYIVYITLYIHFLVLNYFLLNLILQINVSEIKK